MAIVGVVLIQALDPKLLNQRSSCSTSKCAADVVESACIAFVFQSSIVFCDILANLMEIGTRTRFDACLLPSNLLRLSLST